MRRKAVLFPVAILLAAALAAAALLGGSVGSHGETAAAKDLGTMPAPAGVAPPGSPYRYVATSPAGSDLTLVERIDRRGGKVGRWWRLRGSYYVPSLAYDGSGGGLSGDGRTLLLASAPTRSGGTWTSRFAVLDVAVHLRHPGVRRSHAVRRLSLPGYLRLAAISPDGSTAYLEELPANGKPDRHEVRVLDLVSGRLLRRPLVDAGLPDRPVEAAPLRSHPMVAAGLPITAVVSGGGRRAYALFDGNGKVPILQVLDTARGRLVYVPLPELHGVTNPFQLKLDLGAAGEQLTVVGRPPNLSRRVPLLSVSTVTYRAHPRPQLAAARVGSRFLAFLRTPRQPGNVLGRAGVAGYSAEGRRIEIHQFGTPTIGRRVLVLACIHGDECAGGGIEPVAFGCPDPKADIYVVPKLNPDGAAAGSRLDGHGVDLNRNFSVGWRLAGKRGSPEYSGPQPFSEAESRLAARIVRWVKPSATIWIHQHHGSRPFVRAWGQSVPAARRFAHLARIPFRRMHWLAGTGPNWQNHRFPGTSSFVLELPWGPLSPSLRGRLGPAIDRFARHVAQVGQT